MDTVRDTIHDGIGHVASLHPPFHSTINVGTPTVIAASDAGRATEVVHGPIERKAAYHVRHGPPPLAHTGVLEGHSPAYPPSIGTAVEPTGAGDQTTGRSA